MINCFNIKMEANRKKMKFNDSKETGETKETEHQYYEITDYPSGGGYGGTSYARLKNGTGDSLDHRTMIEILWPDNTVSIHKITTETKNSSFYDSDACCTFNDIDVYPFISVNNVHGSTLEKVRLNKIEGIKARIIKE